MLSFSLKLKKISVKLDDKDYAITEMNGRQRDEYLDKLSKQYEFNNDGSVGKVKSFAGNDSMLLSCCLLDSSGVLVSIDTIKSYPIKVLKALTEAANEINGLASDSVDKAKNE